MDQPPSRSFDASNDPEFSPRGIVGRKQSRRNELRARWRIRSLLIAFLVIWAVLLLDPMVGRVLWNVALGFATTLAVLAMAIGLGLMGSGLFAVGDRLLTWLRACSQWPDDGF
jgi:hypothetical protein